MFYLIWVPILIIFQLIGAYFSNKLNLEHDKKWGIYMYMMGLFPLWTIICRYSNNVVFDAILYDSIVIVTYSLSLIILTKINLNWINYVGLIMIFAGIFLFKK